MSNINEFITHVKRTGIAKTNRFRVTMSLPEDLIIDFNNELDTSRNDGLVRQNTSPNPLAVNGGNTAARVFSLMCNNVTIPGYTASTQEQNYGGGFTSRKMPHDKSNTDFEMQFYASGDMTEKKILDAWYHMIFQKDHRIKFYDDFVVDILVEQLNEADQVVYKAVMTECYPGTIGSMIWDKTATNAPQIIIATMNYRKIRENDDGHGEAIRRPQQNLGYGTIVNNRLTLPNAPVTGPDVSLQIVDIYKNIERVKRAMADGLSPREGARILRASLAQIRNLTGLPTDEMDGVVKHINDVLFVAERK